jgi:hypothetical protein
MDLLHTVRSPERRNRELEMVVRELGAAAPHSSASSLQVLRMMAHQRVPEDSRPRSIICEHNRQRYSCSGTILTKTDASFNVTYNDDQKKSHADYIELSMQSQFHKRDL